MSRLLPAWTFDETSIELGEKARLACSQLRLSVTDDQWINLVGCGVWWVHPFGWFNRDELAALRFLPHTPIEESPVVLAKSFEVETLASSPRFFVSSLLAREAISTADRWRDLAALPDESWSELERLHVALGGRDLSLIKAMLADERLRTAVAELDAEAVAEVLVVGDSAPQSRAFFEYASVAKREHAAPVPAVADFGCWSAAAAALSFVTNTMKKWKGTKDAEALEAAWLCVNQPAALDSSYSSRPSQFAPPFGASPDGVPLQAAAFLVAHSGRISSERRSDPLWTAVEALASQRREYDIQAHLKAAEQFIAIGDAERAYNTLTSASYWTWANFQQPNLSLMTLCFELAASAGWTSTYEGILATADRVRAIKPD